MTNGDVVQNLGDSADLRRGSTTHPRACGAPDLPAGVRGDEHAGHRQGLRHDEGRSLSPHRDQGIPAARDHEYGMDLFEEQVLDRVKDIADPMERLRTTMARNMELVTNDQSKEVTIILHEHQTLTGTAQKAINARKKRYVQFLEDAFRQAIASGPDPDDRSDARRLQLSGNRAVDVQVVPRRRQALPGPARGRDHRSVLSRPDRLATPSKERP